MIMMQKVTYNILKPICILLYLIKISKLQDFGTTKTSSVIGIYTTSVKTTTTTTKTTTISSQNLFLVYYCGFETDLCGLNGAADAWIRYNTKTPSSNTGPTSAYNGSYFVYFESSEPNYLNSKSLPLSLTMPVYISLTAVRLRYALHAYGNSIQSFNVLIYSNNNALLKNDQIITTQLQTSSNDRWNIMDNTYSFGSVIKRIDFVVTTFEYLADIAIDDLAVYSVEPCSSCSVNVQCITTNDIRQCVCNGNTCSDPCSLCSVNAQCVTTNGVRQCVCNKGFFENGNTCSYDLCSSCSVNAQCITTNGVRRCVCNNGFIGNGNTCSVDPCSSCSVNAQCMTTNGVRQCVCNIGFVGNGITCTGARCASNQFQCKNSICIPWYYKCDIYKHCNDGSDEDLFLCGPMTTSGVPNTFLSGLSNGSIILISFGIIFTVLILLCCVVYCLRKKSKQPVVAQFNAETQAIAPQLVPTDVDSNTQMGVDNMSHVNEPPPPYDNILQLYTPSNVLTNESPPNYSFS